MKTFYYLPVLTIIFSGAVFAGVLLAGENKMIIGEFEPGYQYVIGSEAGIVHKAAKGLADITGSQEMTFETTLSAFSMTKTFTAIALLQLAESNSISLDDSVNRWVNTPYSNSINVRQLITHTSGIRNPLPLNWVHLPEHHITFEEQPFLEKILDENKSVKGEPGIKYRYSNIGYWLAGQVIEAASGLTYQDYVTRHILEPLNLKPSQIGFDMNESTIATGYLKRLSPMGIVSPWLVDKKLLGAKAGKWREVKSVYLNGAAYGGLFARADAVFVVLRDLLQDDSVLLGAEYKRQLFTQQRNSNGELLPMTLGWHVGEAQGVEYLFKEGGGAGYHSEMRLYPQSGFASVLMSNRTSFNVGKRLTELDSAYIR